MPDDPTQNAYNGTASHRGAGMPDVLLPAGGKTGAEPPITAGILLVDDKPKNLFALAEMLDSLGENIVQATSGVDALRCLLRRDFAIVLVDGAMADLDGDELAAVVCEREGATA